MKQSFAVLDFGTRKITVMVGHRGINNSIAVDSLVTREYAGFANGEWLEPEGLNSAVEQTVAAALSSSQIPIDKVFVGVPGDFLMCRMNEVSVSLGKKRRVLDRDIENLHDQGNIFGSDPDWKVINIEPVYYCLDDERKLIMPVGLSSTKIYGNISYILARRDFIDLVDSAVLGAGISETEYVATPLAEILFLFDDYKRDNHVLLADVGALSTTLTIARGDGICRQYFFPWGGERITASLAESLEIPLNIAEKLKRSVILSLDPAYTPPPEQPDGIRQVEYSVEVDSELLSYGVSDTNAIVELEIKRLARYIDKALKFCDYEFPDHIPLSVTGGGLNIRGATNYLGDCVGRQVETVKPGLPLLDSPQLSSTLGLMDMVLNSEAEYAGVMGKIRRWLFKRK